MDCLAGCGVSARFISGEKKPGQGEPLGGITRSRVGLCCPNAGAPPVCGDADDIDARLPGPLPKPAGYEGWKLLWRARVLLRFSMVSEGGDLRSLGWKGRGVAFSDPASCRARARANSRCSCCAKMRRIESSLVGVSRTVYATEKGDATLTSWPVARFPRASGYACGRDSGMCGGWGPLRLLKVPCRGSKGSCPTLRTIS